MPATPSRGRFHLLVFCSVVAATVLATGCGNDPVEPDGGTPSGDVDDGGTPSGDVDDGGAFDLDVPISDTSDVRADGDTPVEGDADAPSDPDVSDACGNGELDEGEQCDDGNDVDDDDCANDCTTNLSLLCGGCETDDDCFDLEAACMTDFELLVCTILCAPDEDDGCPPDFECLPIPDNDEGVTGGFCVPQDEACGACGNGELDDGEECDDGNRNAHDGCTPVCTVGPICDDGTVDEGEECDDGVVHPTELPDTCRSDCKNPRCGDNVVDPRGGEECDDGNTVDGDGTCQANCLTPMCGDSIVDPAEECDDGNTTNGDGTCQADCQDPECGDGIVDPGEECDDGNTTDGDGTCQADCQDPECGDGVVDPGEECDDGNTTDGDRTCQANCQDPACGDGILDPGEECDDGNTTNGDGTCQADCQSPACGDGILDPGEECDDGNTTNGDGTCQADCQDPICGDGIVDPSEECDDGNTTDGDGTCQADCVAPFCGDTIVDPGEECDDGNTTDGDGTCQADCQDPECGDGIIDPDEECDDGNTTDGDGTCQADCVAPFCGDSILDPAEQCDDGNNASDDGCSSLCGLEEPPKLTAADGATNDILGWSVSIDGDMAIVGAPFDDDGDAIDSGSAYVFVRVAGMWRPMQKLTASDATAGDKFGYAVSISGDTAFIGAPDDDIRGARSGAVYIFRLIDGVWTEHRKFGAFEGAGSDRFGTSVHISGDTAVVGAPQTDISPELRDTGSAYVFGRTLGVWAERRELTASDAAAGDYFGVSVSVSGGTVIVGASAADDGETLETGSAYVFVGAGSSWTEEQRLVAPARAAGDLFGGSVSVDGDTAIVGAREDNVPDRTNPGSAYVFVRTEGVWELEQELIAADTAPADWFGYSVSISGERVIVGAPQTDDRGSQSGSAYVFVRDAGVWTEETELRAFDAADRDFFGWSVSMSGSLSAIGSKEADVGDVENAGAAYVFF